MTLSLLQMQLGLGDTLKTSGVGFVIVLVVLAFIAVLIKLISGVFSKTIGKEKTETKADAPATASAAPVTAPAPVSSRYTRLSQT